MDDQPLYNSRIISNFVEFLKAERPELDTRDILAKSGIPPYELEDEGHWLTQRQVDAFHDILMEKTNDPSLFREAGRYMVFSRSARVFRQLLVGFITPIQAYMMLSKVASYLNRGASFKAVKIDRNTVEITCRPFEGVYFKPYQCENNKGSFEAVAEFFCHKRPVLEHPECLHRGGNCCRYILRLQASEHTRWRRISNYLGIGSVAVLVISLFFLTPAQVIGTALALAGLVTVAAFHTQHLEKKDAYEKLTAQGDAANRLLEQITIGYNNALLVQEIGQAVSSILDIEKLMGVVMETLRKRLNFDRAMIMLADSDKTYLVYTSGYGYDPEVESILKTTNFRLDNPRSRGPFVVAFREQRPFLVDDVDNLKDEISPRTLEFIRSFNVRSFICVPIVYEDKSEGVLAVDNYHTKRSLNQSEVNLLMGVARQIAVSVNNARSLHRIMESEERFRRLSENSPDIIYTTDETGVITYISPAARNILKYERDEMLGRTFAEFSPGHDVDAMNRPFRRVQQGESKKTNFEVRLTAKNGVEKLFYMSGAPNFNARGEMSGIVGTLKDITEQRTLEQQLHHAERMNALGRLTGGISHDFNNILQAVMSYQQLLTMNKTSADPDWHFLAQIGDLTKRATDLVGRLLVFSRKVESSLEPLDMNREINTIYELLRGTLPKNIVLTLHLSGDPCVIHGDRGQLGQVIMNLAVNARDAMPEGGELKIRTDTVTFEQDRYYRNVRMRAGEQVLLTVSDTGQGIERKNLDHIFEPYFTTKEADRGTGIGLSVVYGIIKNHGGFIFCDSEPGRGTTFEIYLPRAEEENVVDTVENKDDKKASPRGNETILLVDDEPSLLETGRELFSLLGYSVLTAESGESALAIIERECGDINLVVLDLMMPGMSGEQCLAEIKKIAPAMKVVAVSGYSTATVRENIMKMGAVDFFQKPYLVETLSERIREILDHSGRSS